MAISLGRLTQHLQTNPYPITSPAVLTNSALILKGAELLRTWLTLDLALCLCDHRFDLRGWHVHKMT